MATFCLTSLLVNLYSASYLLYNPSL